MDVHIALGMIIDLYILLDAQLTSNIIRFMKPLSNEAIPFRYGKLTLQHLDKFYVESCDNHSLEELPY